MWGMPRDRSYKLHRCTLVVQVRGRCQAREYLGREQCLEQLCARAREELRKSSYCPLPYGGPGMRQHGREHGEWLRLQVRVP